MNKKAYFAGGCFWCVEADFYKIQEGLVKITSGYASEYKKILAGYREAVEVEYQPDKAPFRELVGYFLRHIDPTDDGGQFYDRGHKYSTAIFFQSEEEKTIAEEEISEINKMGKFEIPLSIKVVPFGKFKIAEEHHQNFANKNPEYYQRYRIGSGRAKFIEDNWES